MKFSNPFSTLTKFEKCLWSASLIIVTVSFLSSEIKDYLTLLASLVGLTALIFVAKGNVVGQILTVIFSVMYAIISFKFRYYGEMITYVGMTAPTAVMSVIAWSRRPYQKGKPEVKIETMSMLNRFLSIISAILVTWVFYHILKYFDTSNLQISTLSVTTSFLASYLMLFRNPTYALAYAANDIILIILWILATKESTQFLPMIICFAMFFINDIYGFINWRKMKKRQMRIQ